MKTPTRRVIFLGNQVELPASQAEKLVRTGKAQYVEVAAAALETATAEGPERAVRPAPSKRPATKRTKK